MTVDWNQVDKYFWHGAVLVICGAFILRMAIRILREKR